MTNPVSSGSPSADASDFWFAMAVAATEMVLGDIKDCASDTPAPEGNHPCSNLMNDLVAAYFSGGMSMAFAPNKSIPIPASESTVQLTNEPSPASDRSPDATITPL